MKRISTVVIGAGQAGLAMSCALTERSVPHVVLERGDVANSWRTERWDSLRLLTPSWQSRLPGYSYAGKDPDGFMSMAETVDYISGYAARIDAPVETRTTVHSVGKAESGYRVLTSRGEWVCKNLVLASGACNRARIPGFAQAVPQAIRQLSPLNYRNPTQLLPGGVLIVGASATGVQLAAELQAAGHDVILAAGNHIRMPRCYRGHDIQWWMDCSGVLSVTAEETGDLARTRAVPSLQLVGETRERFLDLNRLQTVGVQIVGRLAGIRDGVALFSGSLANAAALSDLKMNRALDAFDAWASKAKIKGLLPRERFDPTFIPNSPGLSLDLSKGRVSNIIWATGFQPDFDWLNLPVFGRKGRLEHRQGIVAPGLYVLGLPFLRTRRSSLIDGVGADASALADHLDLYNFHLAA